MKIVTAFDYMLRGLAVNISQGLRNTVRGSDIGTSFYIASINEDKTVNLRGLVSRWEFKNIPLTEIDF